MTRNKKFGSVAAVVTLVLAGMQLTGTFSCGADGKPEVDVIVSPVQIIEDGGSGGGADQD